MLSKRARALLSLFLVMALLSLVVSCKKKMAAEDDDEDQPELVKYKPTGSEGTIKGSISLNGPAPAPKAIDMNADSACAAKNPNAVAEDIVVKDGKVEYAFVYIKDGTTADGKKISGLGFDVPADAVTLDQNGCHYKPHVVGIQTGQKLNVINSDPTTHNVNVQPKNNQPFNQAQSQGAPPINKAFTRAETLIPVKCNQHPWMKAYIGVLSHPFFAVSKDDGSFEIKGVPPGKYTIAVWHEKFKQEKTMEVTVDKSGTATADFSLDATAIAADFQSGSWEVLPALDLPMLMMEH